MEKRKAEYLPEIFYDVIDFMWEHPNWATFLVALLGFGVVCAATGAIARTICETSIRFLS